jgi:hypothetical protein
VFGREGPLFETVQDKAILKTKVQIILQGAIKVKLRFGLAPQGGTVSLGRSYITRYLYGIYCLDLPINIDFLSYVNRGGIVESRVFQ